MDSNVLYAISGILLLFSFWKSKEKTMLAIRKAWKSFERILPQFFVILLLVGFLLAALDAETISHIIGSKSGWLGVFLAAVTGSVALIPGFIAFVMCAALLENGAGYMQISAFLSTLMMVGLATLPMEIRFFGKKAAVLRNLLAFLFSFVVAAVTGLVVNFL